MNYCRYQLRNADYYQCCFCGRKHNTEQKPLVFDKLYICRIEWPGFSNFREADDGPGAILHALLARKGYHVDPNGSCHCQDHAKVMNFYGVQWCQDNIDMLTEWLQDSARQAGWNLPFQRTILRGWVRKAIRRSMRQVKSD